uniref:Uncharacterized protein n=1 Tax=Varanus komodoensis TaxID=61221 RepID=A0A8D2J314_VARKO
PQSEDGEESACSICLDYFRDPVSITECGHNFCRACLSKCSKESDRKASCPQCKGTFQKRNLRYNRHLARIVEIARKIKGAEGKVQLCEKHWEPQKLFCKDHEAPICLVCDRAKEHKDHQVVPLEEASQEYQVGDILPGERLTPFPAPAAHSRLSTLSLQEQAKAEREEMVAQFRRLHRFLEEQEKHLLAQVDQLQEQIARKAEDNLARLSKELSSLEGIMREVEEKSQQPAAELLQVGGGRSPHIPQGGANVTLDPDTAHPRLLLSEDHKSRFSNFLFVLGCEGFTVGRHSWKVRVGSEGKWAVGVARESVNRKGPVHFSPKEGFWVLWYSGDTCKACINLSFALPVSGEPKTIRVSLNCDGGQVAFYDADREMLLYAFSGVPCAGEPLFPFFYVYGDALLRISS